MDTTILVQELDRNALELIKYLNESDFTFKIAALMKNEETKDWVLVLGIPNLQKDGSRNSFEAIYRIIKEKSIDLSLNDIKLIDDSDVIFSLLRTAIKTDHNISRIVFNGNYINGFKFPDSILYRVE